jgi:hypothetical protein
MSGDDVVAGATWSDTAVRPIRTGRYPAILDPGAIGVVG